MIKILIVDDKVDKTNNIANIIWSIYGKENVLIHNATYAVDAKKILSKESIDILILDICLPERVGSNLQEDVGIKLLKQIKESHRYIYPRFVIALSEYEKLAKKFSIDAGIVHTSIFYDISSNEWEIRLTECIKTAISILSNNSTRRGYDYDIAVICALKEELEIVKESIENVSELRDVNDNYTYLEGSFLKDGKKIRVVMACSTDMGMVPAATLTTKLIYNFAPRYVVMTGITAGISGKANIGDVIVAEYCWDYGAGKEAIIGSKSVHRNTIQQITLDADISSIIRKFSEDTDLLKKIRKEFEGNRPENDLKVILGTVATGASVVADSQVVEKIQSQIRDTIGIEMEIYGVYYASKWAISPKPKYIALKSVCDFANAEKNDTYHEYASYTSAKVFVALARNYFDYDF